MLKNTDVAVFILNYNTSIHTINCVNSVFEKTPSTLNIHVYVIDNGSKQPDFNNLKQLELKPNLTLIRNDKNLGFFGGYLSVLNKGVAANYYYFLNNDCLLLNNTIEVLVNFMYQNSNVGVCSGRIYGKNMEFEPSFNFLPTLSRKLFGGKILRTFYPNKYPNRNIVPNKPIKVETVSGSSFLMSKKSYDAIGSFDDSYFLYCEEEELGISMAKLNLDIYTVPDAEFQHLGGMSSAKSFAIEREYFISLNHLYSKHYSAVYKYATLSIMCFKYILKGIFKPKYLRIVAFLLTPNKKKYSLRNGTS